MEIASQSNTLPADRLSALTETIRRAVLDQSRLIEIARGTDEEKYETLIKCISFFNDELFDAYESLCELVGPKGGE